jgi:FkbM family methyltransferase
MISSLAELFQESVEDVRTREQTALECLLDQRDRKVVLFGAGTLGRRALPLLREIRCDVVAFTDNNVAVWGTNISEIPVLSPEHAASLHGETALFLVTIWNDHHWFSETFSKLTRLGCTLVSTFAPLFWRFPDRFLQVLLLNEPPHRVYRDARAVLQAEQIWADEDSLHAYRANIRWRALGDASDLPGRPERNTYFPDDLFHLDGTDSFLDCGAFDGDTIRELLACRNSTVKAIHAVEADAISFGRLREFVDSLEVSIRSRINLHNCAVGSQRGFVRFECNGTLISRASEKGSLVEVATIDDIFSNVTLTLIKMDIEGAEYDALRGGIEVIRRDRPILAICVYHTQRDIWRIPLLVHEIVPEHKLYLRAYEGDGFQTVMYAVPSERVLRG